MQVKVINEYSQTLAAFPQSYKQEVAKYPVYAGYISHDLKVLDNTHHFFFLLKYLKLLLDVPPFEEPILLPKFFPPPPPPPFSTVFL